MCVGGGDIAGALSGDTPTMPAPLRPGTKAIRIRRIQNAPVSVKLVGADTLLGETILLNASTLKANIGDAWPQ